MYFRNYTTSVLSLLLFFEKLMLPEVNKIKHTFYDGHLPISFGFMNFTFDFPISIITALATVSQLPKIQVLGISRGFVAGHLW